VAASPEDRAVLKYRIHWHVLLIHFPIAFFLVAFGFQMLHLFLAPACFELSTNVAFAAGTVMMIPTTWSGWVSWKHNYNGAKVKLFKIKITAALLMLGLSIPLAAWRFFALGMFEEARMNPGHWIYLAGNVLLVAGAVIEGYYGGRLHHR
jgi:uncharacterized membrane protein